MARKRSKGGWSVCQNNPKGNASLGDVWTSKGSPGVNLFLWEFQTKNPVHRKFLAETGFRSSYNSLVINEKFKFFSVFNGPALWMHWGGWFYWHFCSEDGSWRFWSSISKEFMWSLEWLWALGEAEGLLKALLVEFRLENWGKRRLGEDLKVSLLTAALENFILHSKMISPS